MTKDAEKNVYCFSETIPSCPQMEHMDTCASHVPASWRAHFSLLHNKCSPFTMRVMLQNTTGLWGMYPHKHMHIHWVTSHTSWFGSLCTGCMPGWWMQSHFHLKGPRERDELKKIKKNLPWPPAHSDTSKQYCSLSLSITHTNLAERVHPYPTFPFTQLNAQHVPNPNLHSTVHHC